MNDGLLDAFRHNAWATRELLLHCEKLTETQLQTTVPGTYGSIIATLQHIATAEGRYNAKLTDEDMPADWADEESPSPRALAAHFDLLADRWERLLAQPIDAERKIVAKWPDGTDYDVPAGVYLAQALQHANEHRAHVCTILSSIGVPAPHSASGTTHRPPIA